VRVANRVRALCRDARRAVRVLPDAHAAPVAALASARALPPPLAVAAWYATHLPHPPAAIVVLSDALAPFYPPGAGGDDGLPPGVEVLPASAFFPRFYAHAPALIELYETLASAAAARAAAAAAAPADAGGEGEGGQLTDAALTAGLASGELVRGVLSVSRRFPEEATVRGEGAAGLLVLLPSRAACGRALHGDAVAVRLLPRAAWVAPRAPATAEEAQPDMAAAAGAAGGAGGDDGAGDDGGIGAGRGGGDDSDDNDGGGEDAAPAGAMPTGVVAGVLTRASHEFVACLAADDELALTQRLGGDAFDAEDASAAAAAAASQTSMARERLLCVPMDRRLPLVRVYTRHAARLLGARFVLRLDSWARGDAFPEGHVVRVLGRVGDLATERDALLAQHRVVTEPFCAGALAELPVDTPAAPWAPPPDALAGRLDLRGVRIASIDPPGCTDVDDALSVAPRPAGAAGWRVGVHIADVTAFVAPGGALDAEAAARGTTVYLVDRRFDMLPPVLSENLCSLLADRERLAVSVLWDVEPDGTPVRGRTPWAGRTLIRSRHQLTYGDAQALLDGGPPPTLGVMLLHPDEKVALRGDLCVLDAFSRRLRAAREAAGALELASAEVRFTLGADGLPCTVAAKAPLPVMGMVAELMIAANGAVAERIAAAFPNAALLRRHAPPRVDGLRELARLAGAGGLAAGSAALADAAGAAGGGATLADGGRAALTAALAAAEAQAADPAAAELLKATATRAMSEAEYACTGGPASPEGGFSHFGLALRFYTHFTSPIRRYADVTVHRQLMAALAVSSADDGGGADATSVPAASGSGFGFGNVLTAPPVTALADNLNARHRAAKAVQKACSELYLLLLLKAAPRVERAVVAGLRPDGLLLFVPRFHVRAPTRLADASGAATPPATHDADPAAAPDAESGPRYALDASEPGVLRMLRCSDADGDAPAGGAPVAHEWRVLQRVWVELRAGGSRAHGLALRARLLHETHPAAVAAAAAARGEGGTSGAAAAPRAASPPPLPPPGPYDAPPAAPRTPGAQPRAPRCVCARLRFPCDAIFSDSRVALCRPEPPPPPSLADVMTRMQSMWLHEGADDGADGAALPGDTHTTRWAAAAVAPDAPDVAALRAAATRLEDAAGGAAVRADAAKRGSARREEWLARAAAARAAVDAAWAALRAAERAAAAADAAQ
jgi:VacB/RNase II family 3'-5' exoribonuclease